METIVRRTIPTHDLASRWTIADFAALGRTLSFGRLFFGGCRWSNVQLDELLIVGAWAWFVDRDLAVLWLW